MTFAEAAARCPESLRDRIAEHEPETLTEILDAIHILIRDERLTSRQTLEAMSYRALLRNRRDL